MYSTMSQDFGEPLKLDHEIVTPVSNNQLLT